MLYVNESPVARDFGGRILPPGGTADLDPADPDVTHHVAAGWLRPVDPPAAPASNGVPRQTRTTTPEKENH